MDALDAGEVSIAMEPTPSSLATQGCCVDTPYGKIKVTIQGDTWKPAILTYHDLGLNHTTTFSGFLSHNGVTQFTDMFSWFHVDAPGQETGASRLSEDYQYPTLTQMAEQIECIAEHFQLSCFVAIGVGVGANVLARYAVLNTERLRGLVLVNLRPSTPNWASLDWLWAKAAIWQTRGCGSELPQLALSYLTRHAFGQSSQDTELVRLYQEHLSLQSPHNLSLLLEAYNSCSSVAAEFVANVQCACLFVVTETFQYKDQVEKLCSILDSQKSTLLEVSDSSALLFSDHPVKMATALQLFVQGLGMVPSFSSLVFPTPAPPLSLEGHAVPLHPVAYAC